MCDQTAHVDSLYLHQPPPPCLTSKGPTQTVIGHSPRLLGAPLPATRACLSVQLSEVQPIPPTSSLLQSQVFVVILSDLFEACCSILHVAHYIVPLYEDCPLTSNPRSPSVFASLGL